MLEPLSIIRNYIVATTDRRLELQGPKWAAARQALSASMATSRLETVHPHAINARFEAQDFSFEHYRARACQLSGNPPPDARPGADQADAVALDAVTKLSLLLRYSVLPLRWEPINEAAQHRGIASPAALFPIDLYVIGKTLHGVSILRSSPRDLCLIIERENAHLDEVQYPADTLTLAIIAKLGNCVEPYGEFSPCLVALEAGMLQCQLSTLCAALGWQAEVCARHDEHAIRNSIGLEHWSEVPLVSLTIRGDGIANLLNKLQVHEINTLRPAARHGLSEQYPRMRELISAATQPALSTRPALTRKHSESLNGHDSSGWRTARWSAGYDLFKAIENRSSGYGEGISGWRSDWSAAQLRALLDDAAVLFKLKGESDLPRVETAVSLAARFSADGAVQTYTFEPDTGRLAPLASSPAALAVATAMCRFNHCLMVNIGVDDAGALSALGPRAFFSSHIAAGALAQCFCLAAAGHGLTARPLRSYTDREANLLMPLNMRIILQIQVGFETHPNPAFLLG